MRVFASTTYLGPGRTSVLDALHGLSATGLEGVELGSTHFWEPGLANAIKDAWDGPIAVHNYFPPAQDDLVLNLADENARNRRASIEHVKSCLAFAADVGAELYTVHPGFLAKPIDANTQRGESAYDFKFSAHRTSHDTAFNLVVDALQELLTTSDRLGVPLAIETEGSRSHPGILIMEQPEEYRRLFQIFPDRLNLNFNLAHSRLAADHYGYALKDFIIEFRDRFAAVELSHNDGYLDQHWPFAEGSWVFDWLDEIPDVPYILEFRDSSIEDIANSVKLLRNATNQPQHA